MLENVNSEKLLGVIFDKHLSWKHHFDKTAKTLSKNIDLLKRIHKYLPHQTRLTLYKTFIQPHIDHCSTIWGQSSHISRVHILQKISLRLIKNVPNLTHSVPLFKESQVMPIHDLVIFRTVTMVYKTLHSLTPTYTKELFTYQSDISTRNTRYSKANKLYVPKQNVCVSRRALRYNGYIEFNKLLSGIQDCKTLASFI